VTYYQILKQRRIDLKLSIQDVSNQTRLAPEYIKAIEENDLDVFSDDYSFVRYFVHSYANAIGVNWDVIQLEVDQTIKYYAHKKNMALTMAQQKIVQNIPRETAAKRTKKKRSRYQTSVSRTSRMLHWPKKRISRLAILGIGALALFLVLSNVLGSSLSAREENAREAERKAELQAKEQETQRLSEQRKETKLNEAKTTIQLESQENGIYYINSEQAMPWVVELKVSVPNKTKIELYQGDTLIAGSSDQEVDSDFSAIITCEQPAEYRLVISQYANNAISLNGNQVIYQPNETQQDKEASLTLAFGLQPVQESQPDYDGNSQDEYWGSGYDESDQYYDPYAYGTDMEGL